MYIKDLHNRDIPHLEEATNTFFSERLKKEIQDKMDDILHEQFEDWKETAASNLNDEIARRAESFVERLLKGDKSAANHLWFGDSSRYESIGYNKGKPWAHLIHGSLFLTNEVDLRRRIVEAHKDFFESERIKDLESIVDGLTRQVRELEQECERLYERLR